MIRDRAKPVEAAHEGPLAKIATQHRLKKSPAKPGLSSRVSDGTRTHDRLDHNQELYQLSYAHRGGLNLPAGGSGAAGAALTGHAPAIAGP
jgi:hypothetical protein